MMIKTSLLESATIEDAVSDLNDSHAKIAFGGVFNDHDEYFKTAYGNRTPKGRMADKDEITGIIIYLLSDPSRYCTGQNFIIAEDPVRTSSLE